MRPITIIIATILFSVPFQSQAQDSVRVIPLELKHDSESGDGQKPSYPVLTTNQTDIDTQIRSLNFESAKKALQTKLTQAKRRKQATEDIEQQMEECEKGLSALRATNKIVFIDSIVVDKQQFLSAYKFDKELGSISLSTDGQMTSFTTELGNLTYRSEMRDGQISIKSYFIEDGMLTTPSPLDGVELSGDMNYPFLMADGTTLYFASRSNEGHGNYDIYVTRYDTEDKTYLQPTNLGFPFNSYANDYMMVVDESLGIGWFASDRNQPEDKVCVYTFIQPKSRRVFDYETDDHETIMRAASIASIKDTWAGNDDAVHSARQQLTLQQNQPGETDTNHQFSFIINDRNTYHALSDFKNSAAKAKFAEYQKELSELETLTSTLSQLRQNAKGTTIRSQILQLESQVSDLYQKVHQSAKQVRALELQ